MGSVDDILRLCRLCLVKEQVNVPIFDDSSDIRQTFLKISSCLPVKVTREDHLPKRICDDCSYKLDMLYIFRNTSTSSEKQLLTLLEEAGLSASAPHTVVSGVTIAKPEIQVKQETFDATELRHDEEVDAQDYLMQQSNLTYQQNFVAFGESSQVEEGPAPKRAKRAAAMKQTVRTAEESDEEDMQAALAITKAEGESDDSEEMDQPDYVEAPSTSADDQPGPSGVGKDPIEAPFSDGKPGGIETVWTTVDPNTCVVCNKSFSSYLVMRKHQNDNHPDLKLFQCDVCNKSFKQRFRLTAHKTIHSTENKFYCDHCNEYLKTPHQLKKHQYQHKNPEYYKRTCDECGRVFACPQSLIHHRKIVHIGIRYKCEFCDKIYTCESYLNDHKKTHEKDYEKPNYECEVCKKVFISKGGLRCHFRTEHKGRMFLCEICGKVVTSPGSLRDHMTTHTGDRSFGCGMCDKMFSTKSSLKMHENSHTKQKTYPCKVCGKIYTQQSTVNVHMRSAHTGERPYECQICPKRFVTRTLLNTHAKKHTSKS